MSERVQSEDCDKQFQNNLNNITSQISQIRIYTNDRQKIYQQCLQKYKSHLQEETQKISQKEKAIDYRNNSIRQSFQLIYKGIYEGSDHMLRSIRKTYEAKKKFWNHTIQQFASSSDIELKKQMYQLKKDSEQRYLDAIEQRKSNKMIPFKKLVSKYEKDTNLLNYQQSNFQLEANVTRGTLLKFREHDESKTRFTYHNKQNYMNNNYMQQNKESNLPSQRQSVEKQDILKNFMKR